MGKDKITVVQMLPELNSGGVERGTLELGAFLAEKGHRSIVISGGGRLVEQLEKEGSQHVNWQVGKKSLSTFKYILPLRRLLLEEKVDILHLRSRVPAWVGYLAWKSIPKDKRPKLVTTFHGFYSVNWFSAIMARGEKVIAISRTIADHIKLNYDISEERIEIIFRGVDSAVFSPETVNEDRTKELKEKWAVAKDSSPIILLPGRITPLKGHDVFINALSMISDQQWTAIILGDPAENPRHTAVLEKLIEEKGLSGRVKFVGHCHDMPSAYWLTDIVVSATSTKPEAFGRVAIEAAAMARPVIASAHGGSLETVLPGETGWLVKPGDKDELAQALRTALADRDLCQKLGINARTMVENNFSKNRMCEGTFALYRTLLARGD